MDWASSALEDSTAAERALMVSSTLTLGSSMTMESALASSTLAVGALSHAVKERAATAMMAKKIFFILLLHFLEGE